MEFKNHKNKFRCPFVIYADFESLLQENLTHYNTEIRHMHNASSYMFNVVSIFDEYKFEPKIFRGENAIKNFLHELLKTKDEILNIINKNTPMKKEYAKPNVCQICEKTIDMYFKDIQNKNDFLIATSEVKLEKFLKNII